MFEGGRTVADADPEVALPAHRDATMGVGVDGATVPGVARDGEEERGDGVDGLRLVDIFNDDHERVGAADVLKRPRKGSEGDGVLAVRAVVVATRERLTGRAGDEAIHGWRADGLLGGGVGEHK